MCVEEVLRFVLYCVNIVRASENDVGEEEIENEIVIVYQVRDIISCRQIIEIELFSRILFHHLSQ